MRKFRIVMALFMVAMMFSFAACSSNEPKAPPAGPAEDPADTPKEGLRIVIVTSGSSVDDGSFNQDNYEGILDFIKNNPEASVRAVTSSDIASSINDVEAVVGDYDVVVLPGFQFSDVSYLAVENPEKFFILVDTFPAEYEGKDEFANIYAMTFKEQESGFFAGIAAALETKTGKVGFVGGIAFPPVVNYHFGFDAGVYYANKNLGTNAEIIAIPAYSGTDVRGVEVGGNYVQSFGDEATGKVVGEALISAGCDILFVAAGGSGNGVFTAAKENTGVYVIGCDVDQFNDGVFAGGNIVLTSGLKNMRINVTRSLEAINKGAFKGGNYVLGAETDSTGYISASGRHQLSNDTLAALADAYAKVKSGELLPPGNFFEGNIY